MNGAVFGPPFVLRGHSLRWAVALEPNQRNRRCPVQGAVGVASKGHTMNRIIYIIGLIVVILAILSFLGLR